MVRNFTIGIVLLCERATPQWCGLSVCLLLYCFHSFVVDRLSFLCVGQFFCRCLLLPLGFYPLHLSFVDLET